jgi:hypothetical protein
VAVLLQDGVPLRPAELLQRVLTLQLRTHELVEVSVCRASARGVGPFAGQLSLAPTLELAWALLLPSWLLMLLRPLRLLLLAVAATSCCGPGGGGVVVAVG